jgi:Ca2+-transporting ATPase
MILSENELKNLTGLSEKEASEKLKKEGYNELPSSKRRSVFAIIFEVFKEPMFLLLVASGTIYLVLGDFQEAMMLLGFVFVIMGITIYQESKTEKALEALKDLSSPRALVIRDGEQKRIAGREVVREDLIILSEGDRIPADAEMIWGLNLTVDESLLTGESVSVRKMAQKNSEKLERKPGGDDLPFLFSGSLVVQGQGVAKVFSAGVQTEMGKIGKAISSIEKEETLLQKETGRLVKGIFLAAILLCLVIVLIYGISRNDWLKGILSGITLAMAMLPEEFPVVLTVFLALGAWRISKKKVLTRRISAIETLGASTVLCTDKTGTLTQNKMTIRKLFCLDEFYDILENKRSGLPEKFHELVEYGILASKKDPFDPMEKALRELGYKTLVNTEHLHEDWPFVEEYPLSREILALSHVWRCPDKEGYVVSAKGAPEAIADLCHMSASEKQGIYRHVQTMASEGLRVLGVARAVFKKENLPKSQHDFDFQFIGLVALADPIRKTVPAAIKECYQAGIRVVMITGDYPVTAQNIAKQIGLANPEIVVTGEELTKMSGEDLKKWVQKTNIFARVVPEQKLLLVKTLKENGEIVGMTGDGVNDAPALKAAHIGIAMGERGTDVARESSHLVLLDDDFTSIVSAVRMGRRIFDNLKKAMAYIISVHVPIAGISLLPVIFGWPIVLYPVHIVFLELIIDPACSVIFEAENEEKNIMTRPPRKQSEPLFGKRMILLSLLQGFFALIMVAFVYQASLRLGQSEGEARTITFITLIISNICLILANRSWRESIFASFKKRNPALIWVIGATLLFLGLIIYVPFLEGLFHFSFIHPIDILASLIAGIASVAWFELLKIMARRKGEELLKN